MLLMTHMGLLYEPSLEEPSTIAFSSTGTELVQDTSLKARGRSTHVYNDNNTSTEISYEGTITFTEDEKDIKSISPGGYFKFSKTTFGNRRAIHIESGSNGELKRTYYVGKNQEPYEPEGRKWMADILPELIASSGIGAEDRVKRIYAKKGTPGVLEAIEDMESDYVKGIYFKYLLAQNGLKDNDLKTIITRLGEEVSSDYEKSKLLQQVSSTYLQNSGTATAYITAISDMSSDYEKAKVLSHILNQGKLTDANFSKVLDAINDISSDYEKAKILSQLLNRQNLPETHFKQALHVVADISSDYEKAKVLSKLLTNTKVMNESFNELLEVIGEMSSDYEKAKVLSNLFSKTTMAEKQYISAFELLSDEMSSDYEKSKLMQQISRTMPKDKATVMNAYKKAAKSISSDYEYRKVMASIE
jgi:ribosome-binding factor A